MTATEKPAADKTRYLLPPAAYTDQEWFDREQEQLFERTWVFVGVEHDVTEPGDFFTAQVGRAPVVIVRGRDGVLRAFHNMCRHRGLPVVDGTGNCNNGLVCPYHHWNYGPDGALRAVPQREQFGDIDLDELGLLPVACETWKTLIFVNLVPFDSPSESGAGSGPPPLSEWLAEVDPLVERFHPETLVEVSSQEHHVDANWKLYIENHVDWLHLWYLHRESLAGFVHAEGERHELGPHWASFESRHDGEAQLSELDPNDLGGLVNIPGLNLDDRRNGAHFLFPSLTLFTNTGYWMVGQLLPVDPGHFTLRLRAFGVEGSDGHRFEEGLNVVMHEDYSAVEAIQRASVSPAFKVGPLAVNYERQIMRFQQDYLRYVTPPA